MGALSGTLNLSQQINYTQSILGNAIQLPIQFLNGAAGQIQLTAGAGAKQYNSAYAGVLAIASGSPAVLNLTATLIGPDGSTLTFADLILVAVTASAANTDFVTFGAGTDPVASILGTTGTIKLMPGSTVIIALPAAAGYAVTATTADRLTFTANSGTQSVSVVIAGH